MAPRYALYFAPEDDSPLHRLGSAWLGRDAVKREAVDQPEATGISRTGFKELTASPRRYGLHATLKPPFRLAKGSGLDDLIRSLGRFCGEQTRFELPPLRLTWLGRFLALTPDGHCPELHALADACVMSFDRYRAPAPPEETRRRLSAGLTPGQKEMLTAWGYPYVLAEFRFHITLSSKLNDADLREKTEQAAQQYFARFMGRNEPVSSVCLFMQPDMDQPFVLIERFALAKGRSLRKTGTGC